MRMPACSNISAAIGCYIFLARPGIEVSKERDDITSRCQQLEQSKGQVDRRFSKKEEPSITGRDPSACSGVKKWRIAYGKM
jgi:hypothetical protein